MFQNSHLSNNWLKLRKITQYTFILFSFLQIKTTSIITKSNENMKKYQLIGRKKVFTKSKTSVSYPTAHLCSLPVEILLEIFNCFENDLKTLLKLSLVCNKFHLIINKNFLYNNIIITTPRRFSKFSQTHLPVHLIQSQEGLDIMSRVIT